MFVRVAAACDTRRVNPRRALGPSLLAPAVVLATVAVQFRAVLGGRVYRFEDIADYFEPLWTAAARAMRAGDLPTWSGGAWSGYPLAADPQVGAFYPPNWLWLGLPVLRAYAVCVALHAAWAGLGMFALVRARGRSAAAAALAGVSLAVGGYVVLQVRHVMFVEATAWLPWVALAGLRWLETRDRRALAGTACATGMLLLTGGISMIFYGAWLLVALLVAHAFTAGSDGRTAIRALAALALAALVGAALAGPALIPAAAHARLSPRARGVDEPLASDCAWSGLGYLPTLFLPNLLGQQVRGNYLGGGTQWELCGYYAGVLPFALAMLALARGPRERRGERIALAALLVAAVLLAPGARSPLHRLLRATHPLYGSLRCPARALYLFAIAVPLLAADGLDLVRERLRPRVGARVLAAGSALAVTLVAADLLVAHRAENPAVTLAEARRDAVPDDVVAFLSANRGARFVNDARLANHALHNAGLLWDLENASGYSSVPLWRSLHLLWIANHGAPYPYARLRDDLAAQGLWRFDSPLVDALNVRWLVTDHAPGAPGFVKRLAGSRGLDVWENLEALPRAWVVHRARVVEGPAAAARTIAAAGFDPAREAVLEREPAPRPAPDPSGASYQTIRALDAPNDSSMELGVELRAAGLLVVSVPAHPGWRATLDGAPAAALAADYGLVAVAVPAGSHTIGLAMTDRPLDAGFAIAAVGALALLALAYASRSSARSTPRSRSIGMSIM
jgi:hypothetical protein